MSAEMSPKARPAALLLLSVLLAGCAADGGPEVHLLAAYAYTEVQANDEALPPILDTRGGGRFAFGVQGPVGPGAADNEGYGLQLGGRLSTSYFREDLGERRVAGEEFLTVEDFASLSVVVPQVTLGYRALLGDPYDGGLFVEPGVGAGLAVGTVGFARELEFGNRPVAVDSDGDDYETELSWAVAPYLRLGYAADSVSIGVEGGYQFTGLEFDDGLGERPEEWYVGLFLGVRLGPY